MSQTVNEAPKGLWAFGRRYAVPLWRWYLAGFLALAATNWLTLEIPQLAKSVVNALADLNTLQDYRSVALTIIGLGFLQMIIRALSRILVFWPGRTIETVTKTDIFTKCLALPQGFILRFGMGDLISRLANDVGQLRVFFAFGLLQFLNLVFLLVFTISKMASVHMTLTLVCLTPLALMVLVTRYAMPKMQTFSRENQEAMGRLTNRVTEAFVNVHVIQANAAEESFIARTQVENEHVFATNMKLIFVRNVIFPLMNCLAGLSQLLVLFYGGREVIGGRLTVGDIMAFNVYIGFLSFPLTAVGMILSLLQRARTAVGRLAEIEEAPDEMPKVRLQEGQNFTSGQITKIPLLEIRHLSFSYGAALGQDTPAVLHDINVKIFPGQRIGIFGPIGCGKSTLFNVVTRLFDPPPGTVFWRGRDVLTIPPPELRREIGYAPQTVHLFSDTIRANLQFGLDKSLATEERLKAAAESAQILGEIEKFEHQWNTEIGENGIRLSGGQKQRLALARVFVREPQLLLLDDVLSAVDHETEVKLIRHIHSLPAALFIASHRASALRECDEVIVLQSGRVTLQGTLTALAGQVAGLSLG